MTITLKRLSQADLDKMKNNKHVFTQAEIFTDVPWQAIASIWYRESFAIESPKTPGGPFQFDPKPNSIMISALLKSFVKMNPAAFDAFEIDVCRFGIEDFASAAIIAACWLRHQCRFDLSKDHSDTAIKDAFYGYNGRAWGIHPESSPYVYNEFDVMHHAMTIRGSIPLKGGGRKFISSKDLRPGAFTVYKQLIEEKI
jgi:hypothetical protein